MLTLNDAVVSLFAVLGIGLLVFSYVWYRMTIKPNPCQDEKIPLVAFNEMNKKG